MQHLLRHGPPQKAKEVPTLEQFVPRYVEGHATANRLKPSSVQGIQSILEHHLLPAFGSTRLDAITAEGVQQLKVALTDRTAKTVNNITGLLSAMLKKAVEWKILDKSPCTIKPLKIPKHDMAFYDFDEYVRVVSAAEQRGSDVLLMVLLAGDAGLRLGEIVALGWGDIDLHARRLTVQRADWLGQVNAPKGGRLRRIPLTTRLVVALRAHRHLRSERVLCGADGSSVTRDMVIKAIRGVESRAGVLRQGVHILRHTFCSHLAMRGAPARAIQEVAGHASIQTTQRYMHLSAAAVEDAIRLLDQPPGPRRQEGNAIEAARN